jgi:hypothetical protein
MTCFEKIAQNDRLAPERAAKVESQAAVVVTALKAVPHGKRPAPPVNPATVGKTPAKPPELLKAIESLAAMRAAQFGQSRDLHGAPIVAPYPKVVMPGPALTAWKSTVPTAKHDSHVVATQETARELEAQVLGAIAAATTIKYGASFAIHKTCAEVKRILRSCQKQAETKTNIDRARRLLDRQIRTQNLEIILGAMTQVIQILETAHKLDTGGLNLRRVLPLDVKAALRAGDRETRMRVAVVHARGVSERLRAGMPDLMAELEVSQ